MQPSTCNPVQVAWSEGEDINVKPCKMTRAGPLLLFFFIDMCNQPIPSFDLQDEAINLQFPMISTRIK
jgi:hypothetical protein